MKSIALCIMAMDFALFQPKTLVKSSPMENKGVRRGCIPSGVLPEKDGGLSQRTSLGGKGKPFSSDPLQTDF